MRCKPDPNGFPERKLHDVPVLQPAQMREVQRVAQEDYGIDILQMTENAGRSAAMLAMAMLGGRARGQRLVILVGGGNKGAAGLAATRHLTNWGFAVEPVLGEVETEMTFVARRHIQILRSAGIIAPADSDTSEFHLEGQLLAADLVIDALLGYGIEGPPMGMAAAITHLALQAKRPVLSLDVPTGVSASTGEIHAPAIRAVTTLALDLPKRGLVELKNREVAGELYLADLGIPRAVYERSGIPVTGVFSEGPIVRLRR
jgi:NAD(P)H-hydrate epimerase